VKTVRVIATEPRCRFKINDTKWYPPERLPDDLLDLLDLIKGGYEWQRWIKCEWFEKGKRYTGWIAESELRVYALHDAWVK
jgi:hypothetical protein